MSFIRNTIALGALAALANAQTPPKLEAECADVVIFMSRGNDAPYRDGRTFPMVEQTCGKLRAQGKTCDHIDIVFDNTLGGPYCDQVAEGARNGISQITAFNQKCPCSHIVVNGYSQGAHVAGDVLGGPGGCTFVSPGLDSNSAAGKAIGAALLWGDVMHTANQPYNVLDGADKEKNGRKGEDLARLNRYSSVLRAYCAAGDPVCAGGNVVDDHLNYFELYTDEASSWVVSKMDAVAPLCGASTSSAVPASTAAPSTLSTIIAPSSVPAPSNGTIPTPVPTGGQQPGYPVPTPSNPEEEEPAYPVPTPSNPEEEEPAYPVPTPSSTEEQHEGETPCPSSAGEKPQEPATTAGYPVSPVEPTAFPVVPEPYPQDSCVVVYEVEYVYV